MGSRHASQYLPHSIGQSTKTPRLEPDDAEIFAPHETEPLSLATGTVAWLSDGALLNRGHYGYTRATAREPRYRCPALAKYKISSHACIACIAIIPARSPTQNNNPRWLQAHSGLSLDSRDSWHAIATLSRHHHFRQHELLLSTAIGLP